MHRFLSGLIIGALLATSGLYISGYVDFGKRHGTEPVKAEPVATIPRPSAVKKPTVIARCSAITADCKPDTDPKRGISGSARLNINTHLVVHDLHNGPGEADKDRLGIVISTGAGAYAYRPVTIDKDKWHEPGQVSNDLESACRLTHSDNEFLVAESGRVDTRVGGKVERKPWLGRIFHIHLDFSSKNPAARVLMTPKLTLALVSAPQFKNPDPAVVEFPHSKENYEGLACLHLNQAVNEPAKYLVVLAERGGEQTDTATLYWGVYDTAQPLADREIKWSTAPDVQGIKAPSTSKHPDSEWRDITGLHIDDRNRLFATAAYDTGKNNPPYESVMYQLGVICVNKNDKHGNAALCDYTLPARPVNLSAYVISATTGYHKLESVAAPSGKAPAADRLSIAAEDEDNGGVWWPDIPD